MSTVEKRCTVCGDDVANKKRVKDPKGNYFCDPCYQNKRAAKAPTPVGAGASAAGSVPPILSDLPDLAPPPATNDDLLDLAPVAEAPREELFGCAGCKKLVPQRQVRNLDGEFLCAACAGKRRAPASRASSSAREPEAPDTPAVIGFGDSVAGGLLFTFAAIAVVFFTVFALQFVMPLPFPAPSGHRTLKDATSATGVGALYTVWFLGFALAAWLGSLIAVKTGRGNGATLGATLWKSFATCAAVTIFFRLTDQAFLGYIFGILPWLLFVVRYTILDVSLAACFDFEGVPRRVVSLVAMLFSEVMGVLFYTLFVLLIAMGAIHSDAKNVGNAFDLDDEEQPAHMRDPELEKAMQKLLEKAQQEKNAEGQPAAEQPPQ